jgi:hypothetical protein
VIQQGQVFKLKARCADGSRCGPTGIASQAAVRRDCRWAGSAGELRRRGAERPPPPRPRRRPSAQPRPAHDHRQPAQDPRGDDRLHHAQNERRKTVREAIRCLKRFLARHVFRVLEGMPQAA